MDYKEQIEQAKRAAEKWKSENPIVGVGRLRVDLMVDDLCQSITDLLARAEAAEARVSDLEKLLSAVQNMENFYLDETGFFVFTKKDADDITGKLLAAEARVRELETTYRIEKCENGPECVELGKVRKALAEAEARAEKAERERDAAVSDLEALMWHSGDGCNVCGHAIEVHREPYVRLDCALKNRECTPKWRGHKEE